MDYEQFCEGWNGLQLAEVQIISVNCQPVTMMRQRKKLQKSLHCFEIAEYTPKNIDIINFQEYNVYNKNASEAGICKIVLKEPYILSG